MKPIEIHELAIREAGAAHEWYAARSEDASQRFSEKLYRAFKLVQEHPGRHPMHLLGTRRLRLHRFPYLVVYVDRPELILVVAVAHAKRRPGYWSRRLA